MALTKQIEIGGLGKNAINYIGFFDSKGTGYKFSSPSVSGSMPQKLSANLSLNGKSAGKVTISFTQNHTVATFGTGSNTSPYGAWMDNLLYVYSTIIATSQKEPFSITATFSTQLDIGDIAVFQATGLMKDLEIKKIDERSNTYVSTIYTKEQQLIDYPESVKQVQKNPPPFTLPVVNLDTKGSLPKMIKIIRKADKIYIKPKIA